MKIHVGLGSPLVESQQFCRMETEGEMVPLMVYSEGRKRKKERGG